MKTDELTKKVNQKINQIGNQTNLLMRGGCLQKLKEDLEQIEQDVRGLILLIDNIGKEGDADPKRVVN